MLELGIALHSVLIGVALGVAQDPAAARPLAAALVFHQTFEGFALGAALALQASLHPCRSRWACVYAASCFEVLPSRCR